MGAAGARERIWYALRDGVRQELETSRRADAVDAGDRPKLRHECPLRQAIGRPCVALVEARDVPPDAEAEFVNVFGSEAQLAQRHAKFGDPSGAIDARADIPHPIPCGILDGIAVNRKIAFHAGRIHRHLDAAAPILVGVDDDLELIARGSHIASAEQRRNAVRVRIERAHQHVQVAVVVRDPRFGAKSGGEILTGVELTEVHHRRCDAPDGVVLLAVDHGRHDGTHGPANRARCGRRCGRRRGRGRAIPSVLCG